MYHISSVNDWFLKEKAVYKAFPLCLNNLHACNAPDTNETENRERTKAFKQIINDTEARM